MLFLIPYLLFMSTSAFLQIRFAKRRPIPLMEVKANIIFCFPSTLVLRTRRICWKSSFATRDITTLQRKSQSSCPLSLSLALSLSFSLSLSTYQFHFLSCSLCLSSFRNPTTHQSQTFRQCVHSYMYVLRWMCVFAWIRKYVWKMLCK